MGSPTGKYLAPFGVVAVLGIVICFALVKWGNYGNEAISMRLPGGASLEMRRNVDFKNPGTVLRRLFSAPESAQMAIDWLQDHKEAYSLGDQKLVSALASLCPDYSDGDSSNADTVIKQQQELRDCVDAHEESLEDLRRRAENAEEPFEYVGREVSLQVPAPENQPAFGNANVCSTSPFLAYTVQLTDPRSQRHISVKASGDYPCTFPGAYVDFQLDPTEWHQLFGVPPSALRGHATAVIIGR